MRLCPCVLIVALLVAGCGSAYHRARADLPPGSDAKVALRVRDAQAAQRRADAALETLLASLDASDVPRVATDADRVELAAFDIEREALAMDDVADGAGHNDAAQWRAKADVFRKAADVARRGGPDAARTIRGMVARP